MQTSVVATLVSLYSVQATGKEWVDSKLLSAEKSTAKVSEVNWLVHSASTQYKARVVLDGGRSEPNYNIYNSARFGQSGRSEWVDGESDHSTILLRAQ